MLHRVDEKHKRNRDLLEKAQSEVHRLAGYCETQAAKSASLREELRQLAATQSVPPDTGNPEEAAIVKQVEVLQRQLAQLRATKQATARSDTPVSSPVVAGTAPFGATIPVQVADARQPTGSRIMEEQPLREEPQALRSRSDSPGRATSKATQRRLLFGA